MFPLKIQAYNGDLTSFCNRFKTLLDSGEGPGKITKDWKIELVPDAYEKYDLISDAFIEDLRLQAHRVYKKNFISQVVLPGKITVTINSKESVYDFFAREKDRIMESAKYLEKHPGEIELVPGIKNKLMYYAREIIYNVIGEVGTFRPSLMYLFVRFISAKKVLDPCAGWGDRLIGAMAAKVDTYVSVDPQTPLHIRYDQIWNYFRKCTGLPLTETFKHFDSAFEDMQDSELEKYGPYDLVLTSPPYFDLEVYSDDSRQSIVRYKDLETWYHKFLIPLVVKSAKFVRSGGLVVISISETYKLKLRSFGTDVIHMSNGFISDYHVAHFTRGEKKANLPIFVFNVKNNLIP